MFTGVSRYHELRRMRTAKKYVLFLFCFVAALTLPGMNDTLYICNPGDSIRLPAGTGLAGYSWSPVGQLDNPTVANPLAQPLTTTTYLLEAISSLGENLIINGDFSGGNTGFSSQYDFAGPVINIQGVYSVSPDPSALNPVFFEGCPDHTGNMGNMLVVDGSPQPNEKIWCQTITIQPQTTYAFSTWVASVNPRNPAALQFSINGMQLGDIFNAGSDVCQWRQFYELWNSGDATQADICLVNQNTNPQGNDFALDDFAFFELGNTVFDTFTVVVAGNDVHRIDTSACSGKLLEYNGELLAAGSTTSFRFTSGLGCDSLVEVVVAEVDTVFEFFRVDTLCPGENFTFFDHLIDRDTFICELISSSTSCDTNICLTAVFLTEAAIEAQLTPPSCAGGSDGNIKVEVTAGLPPYQYEWNRPASGSQLQALPAGLYSITVMDAKSCVAQATYTLTEPSPLLLQTETSSTLCNGKVNGMLALAASGGTTPYEFALNGTPDFFPDSMVQQLPLGPQEVTVRDGNGCLAHETVKIPEPIPVVLQVPPDTAINLGCTIAVILSDNSPLPLHYQWSPAEGVACPDCTQTEILPLGSTTYDILATDAMGCVTQASWQVEVIREEDLYLPNAFSPNHDGINDHFRLSGSKGISQIESFQIFDRWGALAFEANGCQPGEPACSWDGTINGRRSDTGVYVYLIAVKYIDGSVARLSGDVLLLR